MTDLDPRLTFDTFVVGPANRLASAAARRAADSPGESYNPLFLYANSGLGKSHLMMGVAHFARRNNPQVRVLYQTLEGYLNELTEALEAGERDRMRDRYRELDILLLDDVQFLAGQTEAQEMLLGALDALTSSGSQVVLASDRPPSDINSLDARLVSRFSGGLIVDIAPPEFETRVAIIQRRVKERGTTLDAGVAEALARIPFRNVRELGGALNRALAVQDLEERVLTPADIPTIVGADAPGAEGSGDAFGAFLNEVSGALADEVAEQEEGWRVELRGAADVAEREGFVVKRIRQLAQSDTEPEGWKERLEAFRDAVGRLREIDRELDRLNNPWPDAAAGLVKDPDRIDEAEAFLASVEERQRPFPAISEGPDLESVSGNFKPLAVKAAMQLVGREKPEYNPLFLWNQDATTARALLLAAGRSFRADNVDARMAVTSVSDFSSDFIRALSAGVAGAWRERWWTVDLLLVYGAQDLSGTERAQDEFFHLFEALKRRGSRVMLTSDRPPARIENVDERLRSRFEGGLVVEVEARGLDATAGNVTFEADSARPDTGVVASPWDGLADSVGPDSDEEIDEIQQEEQRSAPVSPSPSSPPPPSASAEVTAAPKVEQRPAPAQPGAQASAAGNEGPWRPSREKVIWVWPAFEERLVEDLN